MLRRLHPEQPESFAFTPDNQKWAEGQITKYPEGRQASAIIPLLWRAQEQEGWLSRAAIEHVAAMLDMAYIRALEVATFYFMFQLQPVGSLAHFQICGTTSCMICGAEDLLAVCQEKIAAKPHQLSSDGKFSWEEVECLGACANAPMAQIGKDYYEDLTAERFSEIIDELAAGKVPTPGPQNGRFAAEPLNDLTSLTEFDQDRSRGNGSVSRAVDIGDTIKRIDGTEVPLLTPWLGKGAGAGAKAAEADANSAERAAKSAPPPAPTTASAKPTAAKPAAPALEPAGAAAADDDEPSADELAKLKPQALDAPEGGKADDLKKIKGIGPKLAGLLNENGIFHFSQIASWGPSELRWADYGLAKFKGRATRDDWVGQAKTLASGGETEFSKRAKG